MNHLSAWNPLDQLRLLWWLFIQPQQLKAYREQHGEKSERATGKWLISTFLWLPFFLPFSAVGLGIVPYSPYTLLNTEITLMASDYLWASGGLFIAWLLTGLFGDRDQPAVRVAEILAGGLAGGIVIVLTLGLPRRMALAIGLVTSLGLGVGLAEVLAIGFAQRVLLGLPLGLIAVPILGLQGVLEGRGLAEGVGVVLVIVLAGTLLVVPTVAVGVGLPLTVAILVKIDLKENLETGQRSWGGWRTLGLLVAAYEFLVRYSYFGGWQEF